MHNISFFIIKKAPHLAMGGLRFVSYFQPYGWILGNEETNSGNGIASTMFEKATIRYCSLSQF